MSHGKITMVSMSVIFILAFGVDSYAQRTRRAQTATQQEDPNAKKRQALVDAIADIDNKIKRNCASLKDTIISANATPAEFAYDDNQVEPGFDAYCRTGRLGWTAERKFSPNDLEQKPYMLMVTASAVQDLGNSRASPDGSVELISETATITVYDDGATSQQVKWGLDLREEQYAEKFVAVLKDLSVNLKKKADWQTELAALPSPPPPPAPSPPKGKRKKRA